MGCEWKAYKMEGQSLGSLGKKMGSLASEDGAPVAGNGEEAVKEEELEIDRE